MIVLVMHGWGAFHSRYHQALLYPPGVVVQRGVWVVCVRVRVGTGSLFVLGGLCLGHEHKTSAMTQRRWCCFLSQRTRER